MHDGSCKSHQAQAAPEILQVASEQCNAAGTSSMEVHVRADSNFVALPQNESCSKIARSLLDVGLIRQSWLPGRAYIVTTMAECRNCKLII